MGFVDEVPELVLMPGCQADSELEIPTFGAFHGQRRDVPVVKLTDQTNILSVSGCFLRISEGDTAGIVSQELLLQTHNPSPNNSTGLLFSTHVNSCKKKYPVGGSLPTHICRDTV
jgi:hypothetical protein